MKTAEIRHLTSSKNQNHTSRFPSHLESQVVENKRTWLFYARGNVSSANKTAPKALAVLVPTCMRHDTLKKNDETLKCADRTRWCERSVCKQDWQLLFRLWGSCYILFQTFVYITFAKGAA